MTGRILAFLILASALFLNGCMTEGSDDEDPDTMTDGARKPNAPTVLYADYDSVMHIGIRNTRPDEEGYYWIYRDTVLLDQPTFYSSNSMDSMAGRAFTGYQLVDSVPVAGVYTYTVKYGPHKDSLSDASTPYVFNWTGPSPSGRVHLSINGNTELVEIRHSASRNSRLRQVAIERKVGARGDVKRLDSIELMRTGSDFFLADTGMIVEDATLFYRAVGMDFDENWLEPSPWDSIQVKNKVWTFIPLMNFQNRGNEIQASVTNVFFDGSPTTYFLYRNTSRSKDGKVKVDSARSTGNQLAALQDVPEKPGHYVYWVEAMDSHGRTSVRSSLAETDFTGRQKGPALVGLGTSASSIQVSVGFDPNRALILERTADTAKAGTAVDTIYPGTTPGPIYDRPPTDGYWFYRVIAMESDDKLTDPGDWMRSEYFSYAPTFNTLGVAMRNRGDRIEASVPNFMTDMAYVLFRSAYASGRDSVAVDTARYLAVSNSSPLLEDRPAPGTWYYRVYSMRIPGPTFDQYRSEILKVDFTGKPVGPAVTALFNNSSSIRVTFIADLDALAYVLERASDGGKDWIAVDTLPASSGTSFAADRPSEAGIWQYRLRKFLKDMSLSGPGAAMRASFHWSGAATYSNTLAANMINRGSHVEARGVFPDFSVSLKLFRSTKPDYSEGTLVDTLNYGGIGPYMTDAPPLGTYYYWVERHFVGAGQFTEVIYRSLPLLVVFSGAPEIISLYGAPSGVTIGYPAVLAGDTLQVFRSTGKPDDAASFTLLTEVFGHFDANFVDTTVDQTKGAFYHYRLVLIHEGKKSEMGAVKSVYCSR